MEFGSVVNWVLDLVILVFSIVFVGGVVYGGIWYYRYNKKWSQYAVRIWGKDAFGQTVEKKDRGGIFVDAKTKNKRFWLRKNKVGLNPDNIPIITVGKEKIVYLKQIGLKNFKFIKPVLTKETVEIQVGEEDVNWAINSYEREKKRFSNDKLMQYLPFITLGFVSIVILVIFLYLFKKFDVLENVADALVQTAKILANPDVIK